MKQTNTNNLLYSFVFCAQKDIYVYRTDWDEFIIFNEATVWEKKIIL